MLFLSTERREIEPTDETDFYVYKAISENSILRKVWGKLFDQYPPTEERNNWNLKVDDGLSGTL